MQKLVTLRPLPDPRPLVGYLASGEELKPVLIAAMLNGLRLWADGSALRHMTASHHKRLSGILCISAASLGGCCGKVHSGR